MALPETTHIFLSGGPFDGQESVIEGLPPALVVYQQLAFADIAGMVHEGTGLYGRGARRIDGVRIYNWDGWQDD